MKKCMQCKKFNVKNPDHDLCYECFKKLEIKGEKTAPEKLFEGNLDNVVHTVYIMFYPGNDKIGYTNDLNSRIIEIKRDYPENKLVYFREFMTESEARRFEAWLKKLTNRDKCKFISAFQDKIKKIINIS